VQRAFVQRVDGRAGFEHLRVAGQTKRVPLPQAMLAVVLPLRVQMKDAFAVVLRWAARALWVSPAFVLIAGVALVAGVPALGSAAAVGFALVVVTFFGALAAFVFASILAHPVAHRARARLLAPSEAAPAPAPELRAIPAAGARVRVRGTLERIGAGEGPLLRDFWAKGDEGFRATWTSDMVVRPREGAPVVVAPRRAPLVVAPRAPSRLEADGELAALLEEASLNRSAEGEATALEAGAEVEVEGTVLHVAPNAQHVELDGALIDVAPGGDDPYRQGPGGPAIVLGDPIVLRVPR
jgi:hypothetical protein